LFISHRQPHVLDVAELLPGHLRIYSLARCSSMYKRATLYHNTKTKNERNTISEQIKDSYRLLRESRSELKEITSLLEVMKQKAATLQVILPSLNAPIKDDTNTKQRRSLPQPAQNIRMRYLTSLNFIPKLVETMQPEVTSIKDQQKQLGESYNTGKQKSTKTMVPFFDVRLLIDLCTFVCLFSFRCSFINSFISIIREYKEYKRKN
jgi:hypothetical protein